jgi:hypothetical protein
MAGRRNAPRTATYGIGMDRLARVVVGYHGCTPNSAERLIRGEISINEWNAGEIPSHGFGRGISFGEHGPADRRRGKSRGNRLESMDLYPRFPYCRLDDGIGASKP